MNDRDAYIVSSMRTPTGKADRGALRTVRPEALGAQAVRGALKAARSVPDEAVEDVLIGCAFPEGPQGMNMGRIIAQRSGLSNDVPGATINRFCSSGLQTIAMASQSIMAGYNDVVVAGGSESMSHVPMSGFFFQPDPDIVHENVEVYISMGITAENVADKYDVSRDDQDRFALQSHQRAIDAIRSGRFEDETITVSVEEVLYQNGETEKVQRDIGEDEGPRPDTSLKALNSLRPVFKKGGSVTAGNASQRSDGAAAALVMSGRAVKEYNAEPLARLVGFSLAGVPPELMGIGPVNAIQKVLHQTGLSLADIGLIELNEAFAAQALAVIREVGLDEDIVNVNGGAIALGHPLGATGAKLTATLLNEMQRRDVRYGICTMCVGGGMGAAGVFENLQL